jgi:diacylglycerol O-acyltransferase
MAGRTQSRLSLLDSTFLRIETAETPMHVGALQIFSIPDGASRDFVSEVVAMYRRPRPIAHPFNQVLVGGPRSIVSPSARTIDEIDIEYHVRHTALPASGGERKLGELVSHLHSTVLDRTRPLWTCHVIEGLDQNRFAVYLKIHHALTDGVNGMRLAGGALASEPDGVSRAPWQEPDASGGSAKKLGKSGQGGGTPLYKWPFELAQGVTGLVRSRLGGEPVRVAFEAPDSILNGQITNARRVATQQLDLSRVKEIGRRSDASVNDIFLAVCGAALRRYLLDCDALPARSLIAGVPVNLREEGQEGGNAAGFLWATLGTDLSDPVERLEAVKKSMKAAKDHIRSMSGSVRSTFSMMTMGSTVVTLLSGQGARLRPSMNVTISNVPGPRSRLYLNGARLEAFYPVSLAFQGLGMNITCISYADRLNIGVVGGRDGLPHLQRVAIYIAEALDELDAAAPAAR